MNMMGSSREGYEAKQEGENNNMNKFSKASSTSRQWSGFRNPRIVRVSRSFGGKDRHSKVCTIRGLRDRRIRLSVPTAIQLYDLQDKLGLSQPSKVIDWLLEATKFDIDKLPPLHFPQSFSQLQYHPQTLLPFHDSSASHLSLGDTSSTFQSLLAKSRYWDNNHIESFSRLRGNKEIEKGKWIKANEHENQEGCGGGAAGGFNSLQVSTQKLFPMGTITTTSANTHSPLQGGLLNNANISYNPSYTYEPNALSLSQFGSHGLLFPSQVDPYPISSNGVQFQPSLPLPVSSGSQFLFGPSSSTTSIFSTTYAPFMATSVMDNDARQFQFLNSGSQLFPHHNLIPSLQHSFSSPVRPLTAAPFSSKLLDSNDDETDKDRRKDKGSTCS